MKLKLYIFSQFVLLINLALQAYTLSNQKKNHAKNHQQPLTTSYGGGGGYQGNRGGIPEILGDVNRDGQTDFPEFLRVFQGTGMTQYEIQYIYQMADKNHDSKINSEEWENFVTLFVRPFKKYCHGDTNPLLTASSLNSCIKSDPFLEFPGMKIDDLGQEAFDALDKELNSEKFNFKDYLFLRKAHLAWKNCAQNNKLNQDQMECGLHITQGKNFPVSRRLFSIGQIIFQGQIQREKSFINFPTFLHISHVYQEFWNFQPGNGMDLSWREILKGIKDQVLPLYLQPDIVSQMFESIDPSRNKSEVIDFGNFASLLSLYRKFEKYSKKQPMYLSNDEFQRLIKEKSFDQDLLVLLQETIVLSPEDMKIVLNSRSKITKATEEDYIINFLEKSSKSRLKHQKKIKQDPYDTQFNSYYTTKTWRMLTQDMLTIVYNIFSPRGKDQMQFGDFVAFMKISWNFMNFDIKKDGYITVNEIRKGLDTFYSPIRLNEKESQKFGIMMEYNADTFFNIKQVYEYFYYDKVFLNLLVPGAPKHVTYENLKAGLEKLGLSVNEEITDGSREPSALTSQQVFNFQKAFQIAIQQDIDGVRMKRTGEDKKLKEKQRNEGRNGGNSRYKQIL